jgi:hypothetical protein
MNSKVGKRIFVTHEEIIAAPVEDIFPLACPVEELKWIDRWEYNLIYSESGRNENNCIFSERMSTQHFFGPECTEPTCWITTKYDREEHAVHFVILFGTDLAGKYEIAMHEEAEGKTHVTLHMVMTSLTGKGRQMFDNSIIEKTRIMLSFIGQSLKHYCEQGTILKIEEIRFD